MGLRSSWTFFYGPQTGICQHSAGGMRRKRKTFRGPALCRTHIPPVPRAAFRGLDLHQPSWRRVRPRGRAARPSAVRTGLRHCPGAGPAAVTPAREEGCVRPSPSSSDLPSLGTRPRALAKGSSVDGLECSPRGQLHGDPNTTQQAPPSSLSGAQASLCTQSPSSRQMPHGTSAKGETCPESQGPRYNGRSSPAHPAAHG